MNEYVKVLSRMLSTYRSSKKNRLDKMNGLDGVVLRVYSLVPDYLDQT